MLNQLVSFLPPFLLATLVAWLLTGRVRATAVRWGLVTTPRSRDVHQRPVPRLGGVALIFSFIAVLVATELLMPNVLWFSNELRLSLDRHVLGIILGALILLLFGIADDIQSLSPSKQLLGQVLAAGAIIFSGIGIDTLTNPWGGPGAYLSLTNPTWQLFHLGEYTVSLSPWADLLTILWLVLMMNVMNWFDGLDGLAGGVSLIAAVMLALLSLLVGSPAGIVALLLVFAGSMTGFLWWNWHPARIFMGTSGSTFIGFILGVAAIAAGGKLATTFVVLGLPILDAIWVVVTRLRSGRSAFAADQSHLHHRLLAAGFGVRQVVVLMYLLTAAFGVIALLRNSLATKIILALILLTVMWWFDRHLPRLTKVKSNNG